MKSIIKTLIALLLTLSTAPVAANALTIKFNLDEVNTNNTGTNGPWASVTLTDTTYNGKDAVHFVVDPIETAFTNRGSNFGLQSFFFNENTGFGSELKIGNFAPSGWDYKYNQDPKYNPGYFGKFEFKTCGTGGSRANPLSFDIYTNSNHELNIANFSTVLSTEGYLFAAHIAGYNNDKSAKFATDGPASPPVPEPGTMVLLGAGILGLALYGKRHPKPM